MFVERLLAAARERLITIHSEASILEAARLLGAGTDIIVVCGPDGTIAGVITKTDIVRQLGVCQGACLENPASAVMTSHVVLCYPSDRLHDVWMSMRERGLENVPITEKNGRPVGVLNARDALKILLEEAENEEVLLIKYVMGVGYQ